MWRRAYKGRAGTQNDAHIMKGSELVRGSDSDDFQTEYFFSSYISTCKLPKVEGDFNFVNSLIA